MFIFSSFGQSPHHWPANLRFLWSAPTSAKNAYNSVGKALLTVHVLVCFDPIMMKTAILKGLWGSTSLVVDSEQFFFWHVCAPKIAGRGLKEEGLGEDLCIALCWSFDGEVEIFAWLWVGVCVGSWDLCIRHAQVLMMCELMDLHIVRRFLCDFSTLETPTLTSYFVIFYFFLHVHLLHSSFN